MTVDGFDSAARLLLTGCEDVSSVKQINPSGMSIACSSGDLAAHPKKQRALVAACVSRGFWAERGRPARALPCTTAFRIGSEKAMNRCVPEGGCLRDASAEKMDDRG